MLKWGPPIPRNEKLPLWSWNSRFRFDLRSDTLPPPRSPPTAKWPFSVRIITCYLVYICWYHTLIAMFSTTSLYLTGKLPANYCQKSVESQVVTQILVQRSRMKSRKKLIAIHKKGTKCSKIVSFGHVYEILNNICSFTSDLMPNRYFKAYISQHRWRFPEPDQYNRSVYCCWRILGGWRKSNILDRYSWGANGNILHLEMGNGWTRWVWTRHKILWPCTKRSENFLPLNWKRLIFLFRKPSVGH